MDTQEFLRQLFDLLAPAIVAAVGLLLTFALASLKAYLDALKRKAGIEADETIAAQAVAAVEQMHADAEGATKFAIAEHMLEIAKVPYRAKRRLIENAVADAKQYRALPYLSARIGSADNAEEQPFGDAG